MAEENKLQEMIRTSLESIRAMVDANTVVGTPIQTPSGTTVIPISKVSVGYASGGVDFSSKTAAQKNFGGGGGTGVNVTPLGFLVVSSLGNVELLTLESPAKDLTSHIFEFVSNSPEFFEKIKNSFFSGNKGNQG